MSEEIIKNRKGVVPPGESKAETDYKSLQRNLKRTSIFRKGPESGHGNPVARYRALRSSNS